VLDGVADGVGGGLKISVGVGTGGMSSTGGGADAVVVAGAGAVVINGAVEPAGAVGRVDTGAPGRGGWEEYWTGVTGWDGSTCSGAEPMPPAPPGALATGGFSAGVPSSQPTVTAKGSPRATMPKKMYLGLSRTH
jgi:hypothetical protein